MRLSGRVLSLVVFLALFLGGALFHHPVDYDASRARHLLVRAVVDEGQLNIDPFHEETVDKSYAGGHYYSCKAIGGPMLAIPVYWALRHTPGGAAERPMSPRAKHCIAIFTAALPFALTGVLLFWLTSRLGAGPYGAFATAIAFGFGTLAWVHASVFTGHQLAGTSSFLGFILLMRCDRTPLHSYATAFLSSLQALLAGLLVGFSVLCDYSAVAGALVLSAYALIHRMRLADKISYLAGGAICLLLLLAYNQACFGTPFSFSYSSENLPVGRFSRGHAEGLLGVGLPPPEALLGLLVSPSRGLFFIMPVLLISLLGYRRLAADSEWRGTFWVCLFVPVACLLLAAGYYNWDGGWSYGPRFLIPALPFLMVPMALAVDRRGWFALLFAFSFFQVLWAQVGLPHTPAAIANPLIEFTLPLIQYGYGVVTVLGPFAFQGAATAISALLCLALPVVVVLMRLTGHAADREPPRAWKLLAVCACAGIALILACLRTSDPALVHGFRAMAMEHAADEAPWMQDLRRAAAFERSLEDGE